MELTLCGSGQVIHIAGGLTLRMLIYLLAVCITSLYIVHRSLDLDVGNVLIFYVFTTCVSMSICFILGNMAGLFDDIKQLSFFIMLPFIFFQVTSKYMIDIISKVIKFSALFMAIIYLTYIVLIKYMRIIDFNILYAAMGEESDFMFRGSEGELFYKGFLYLVIGLLFWLKEKNVCCSILMILSIYYTMTRGFYVITLVGIVLLYIFNNRIKLRTVLFLILLCLVLLLVVGQLGLFEVGENRAEGDELRILTMQQVFERITPFSFFFGHGFGIGVPIRMVHMENSFLEIFHKQGVLGLTFWGYLLYKIIAFYKRIPLSYKKLASVYVVGTITVYIQSLFNPFLINPIGMGFVLLSFVVCKKLSYYGKSIMCSCSLSAETL